jgi:tetratricopeptide (TPR) repeat protein
MYQYLTMVWGSSDYELYTALYAVKGLMANKNQFAISLMLMLPFVSYGLFTFKKGWRALAGYSVLMILVNIVIIQTRSVWIATLFMMMTFALLSPVFLLNNNLKGFLVNNKKVLSVSLAVFLIVSIVAVMLIRSSGTSGLMKEQVTSTFSTQSSNAQWRIKMWNASLQLAADNPWLGVGAGNWKSAIIPYYHTNFESEYQNWRRPHNDFLWVVTEKGIPGLMLFILLFGLIFFYGYKILFSEKNRNRLLITILMLSGVGAYMVVSLFTFPLERVNQQIYLVLMMAVVVSIFFQSKNTIAHKLNPFKWVNLAILVFSGFSIYYAFLFLNSELTVGKIAASMNAGRPNRTIKYADKAYSPFTTVDYNNIPIKMYRGVANMHLKRYDESLRDLQAALKDFPNQVAVLNNLAIVSSELNKNKQHHYTSKKRQYG